MRKYCASCKKKFTVKKKDMWCPECGTYLPNEPKKVVVGLADIKAEGSDE